MNVVEQENSFLDATLEQPSGLQVPTASSTPRRQVPLREREGGSTNPVKPVPAAPALVCPVPSSASHDNFWPSIVSAKDARIEQQQQENAALKLAIAHERTLAAQRDQERAAQLAAGPTREMTAAAVAAARTQAAHEQVIQAKEGLLERKDVELATLRQQLIEARTQAEEVRLLFLSVLIPFANLLVRLECPPAALARRRAGQTRL